MNKTKPIYRMCAVSREKHLKKEMFRIVKTPLGAFFDKEQKMMGRGIYIKKDLKTIELAYKKSILSHSLKCEVKEEVFLELVQELMKEKRD